jgi:hypothetical protein
VTSRLVALRTRQTRIHQETNILSSESIPLRLCRAGARYDDRIRRHKRDPVSAHELGHAMRLQHSKRRSDDGLC